MSFSFWMFVNGKKVALATTSLLSAPREARANGAESLWGHNPQTRQTFELHI